MPARTTLDLLAHQADTLGDTPALVLDGRELSYADLHRRTRAFAVGLQRMGVRPGALVGLLCTNRPEWVVAALGALAAGASVAAFNTWSKRWDLDHLLEHSRCEILVTLSSFRDIDYAALLQELWSDGTRYPALREVVVIGEAVGGWRAFADVEAADGTDAVADEASGSSGEMILYTSGSTARPKAVRLRQDVAIQHGLDVGARMGIRPGERIFLPVPLFWSYGSANALLVALTHGATLVVQEAFDAEGALSLIEEQACTAIYTLPNITNALLDADGFSRRRVASVMRGMTIGSPRDVRRAVEGLGVEALTNAYGCTELYGGCTVTPHDWPAERRYEVQGPPLPGMDVHIRDRVSGEEMPRGDTGEICVTGQTTEGYVRQPQATSSAFNSYGEYRTGDLGYLDDAGDLHFVGRTTDMIKSGGINIAPLEIEDFLRSHELVQEVAVVGTDDDRLGQVAVAFVRVPTGSAVDAAALRTHCREHLASFKVPALVVVTHDALPTTDTGKLAKLQLRDQAAARWAQARAAAPQR